MYFYFCFYLFFRKQYPFEPLRWQKETLVLDFKEAQELLRSVGEEIEEDFTTAQEKKLGKLIATKYETDFYIIEQYPASVRPFYTMPNKENPVRNFWCCFCFFFCKLFYAV